MPGLAGDLRSWWQSRHARDKRNNRFPKRIDKSGPDGEVREGSNLLWKISLLRLGNSLFGRIISLLTFVGNCPRSGCSTAVSCDDSGYGGPKTRIPCKIPCLQGITLETDAISTASPATQSGIRLGFPRDTETGRKSGFSRIRFGLQTPGSPVLRRKSRKVSGRVREYSRFAETIGGDWFDHDCRPRAASDFATRSHCA